MFAAEQPADTATNMQGSGLVNYIMFLNLIIIYEEYKKIIAKTLSI